MFISVSTSFLLTSTSQRINTDCNGKFIFFWGFLSLLWNFFLLSFAMIDHGLTTTQLKSHINLVFISTTVNICTSLWLKLSVLIFTSSPCHNWLLPASSAVDLTISLSNVSFQDTYFCFSPRTFSWTQLYSVSRLCPTLLDSVLLQALVHRYGFSLTPASLYHLI